MSLETVTYISDLVQTNPTANDPASQGDDHLRNIKKGLLATFPNVKGVVTPTHTELNYVDGVTSSIQTQIDGVRTDLSTASAKKVIAGDGLSGGGDGTADRTLSVDATVVRTSGDQTIAGTKTFTGTVGAPWLELTAPTPNIDFHYGSGTSDFDVRLINDATGRLSVWGNFSVSGVISGNGSGLTSLNASNISSGTISDSRLSGNVAMNNASEVFNGDLSVNGNFNIDADGNSGESRLMMHNSASGSGGGIYFYYRTPDQVLGIYDTVNNLSRISIGSNGSLWANSDITTNGTFGGNGYNLWNLNASNVAQGTLPDGRLSGNIPKLDSPYNHFSKVVGLSGATMYANINMGGYTAYNMQEPVNGQDAATKHYVDTQIDAALQGASYGAVGTYVFANNSSGSTANPGDTRPGSQLHASGESDGSRQQVSASLSGTWRCMGYAPNSYNTLWLRIS